MNNAGTTIVAHGQPTATVYRTADHVQALSQQDGQTQTAFAQPQQTQFSQVASYQQHSQAPTPLQQQVAAQPASTPTFQQQNINQFGQPAYNNQYAQNQFVQQPFGQPGQFSFPTAATLPPPPQATQFGGFAQGQQTAAQFPGFNQQPQQPFNPFQPFQPFQAQQQPQTPYNPFTFPTLPPAATFAPVTFKDQLFKLFKTFRFCLWNALGLRNFKLFARRHNLAAKTGSTKARRRRSSLKASLTQTTKESR